MYTQSLLEIGAPNSGQEYEPGDYVSYAAAANGDTKAPFAMKLYGAECTPVDWEWRDGHWYGCRYCEVTYNGDSPLFDYSQEGAPAPTEYLGYVFSNTAGELLAGGHRF